MHLLSRDQLVAHLNKFFKGKTDKEVIVDKSVLTCCPPDEDVRLAMTTEFRKLLINDGLYYTGESNTEQLCIQRIDSCPIDYTEIRRCMKMSVCSQGISPSDIDMSLMLYYDETNNIKKFKLNEVLMLMCTLRRSTVWIISSLRRFRIG